jgi:ribonuclease-3
LRHFKHVRLRWAQRDAGLDESAVKRSKWQKDKMKNNINNKPADYVELEKRIGYTFKNGSLLTRALTHSSYAYEMNMRATGKPQKNRRESRRVSHNELLEFLGDSILGFIIAEELFKSKPDETEGRLTQKRAAIICERSLTKCARAIGLGDYLLLGANMDEKQSRAQSSILSDAMEAVFAAVYIDGGMAAARRVITGRLSDAIHEDMSREKIVDFKTRLQEYLQSVDNHSHIEYTVLSEHGPAHKRSFTSQVTVNGRVMGTGTGGTKKESEQIAAEKAFNTITAH